MCLRAHRLSGRYISNSRAESSNAMVKRALL
jgi:hypothetical protein